MSRQSGGLCSVSVCETSFSTKLFTKQKQCKEDLSLTPNLPKFGFSFPAKILRAVVLPIPLVPTSPSTSPGRGVGKRWSLKELAL